MRITKQQNLLTSSRSIILHECSGHLCQIENKFWLRSKFNVQLLLQDFRRFNGFSFCSCPNYLPKQLNARKSLLEFNIILAEFLMNKFSSRQRTYRKRIYQPRTTACIGITTIMYSYHIVQFTKKPQQCF